MCLEIGGEYEEVNGGHREACLSLFSWSLPPLRGGPSVPGDLILEPTEPLGVAGGGVPENYNRTFEETLYLENSRWLF